MHSALEELLSPLFSHPRSQVKHNLYLYLFFCLFRKLALKTALCRTIYNSRPRKIIMRLTRIGKIRK